MLVGSTAAGPSIHARTQVMSSMNGLGRVHEHIYQRRLMSCIWRCILGYLLPKAASFPLHTTHQGFAQQVYVSIFLAF